MTRTASGLDVAATGSGKLSAAARRAAADFAISAGLARLAVDGEVMVEPRKPHDPVRRRAGRRRRPAASCRPMAAAEHAMAALVVRASRQGAGSVADLFAGGGAFALRLAATAEVHAVEADAAALAALDQGISPRCGLRRVTVERRDLFRRPLTAKELAAFDGLVFDPPRAGAEEQAGRSPARTCRWWRRSRAIRSRWRATWRMLTEAAIGVTRVVPIDQFLWSPHVEAVALLEKKPLRRASRR